MGEGISLYAYLTFNGNCREAMTFYQECFGGDLSLNTVSENVPALNMPERMQNCIVQATLFSQNLLLVGTDLVPEHGLLKGNAVSLLLKCINDDTLHLIYDYLSTEAVSVRPPFSTDFDRNMAEVTDKFGVPWLLFCDTSD
jgi:PhnB protein